MFPYLICMSLTAMVSGRAQRLPKILRRGDRAASPQRHRDRRRSCSAIGARRSRPSRSGGFSQLVDSGGRRRAASLGGDRGAPHRLHRALPAAAADAGREAAAVARRAGRGRRRHHADQSLRRPDHRLDQGGRDRRPAIRRPRLPAAARRGRHRHRRRAPAGAVAGAEGQPSPRGGAQPEPGARIRAVPDAAGGDRARHHLGSWWCAFSTSAAPSCRRRRRSPRARSPSSRSGFPPSS